MAVYSKYRYFLWRILLAMLFSLEDVTGNNSVSFSPKYLPKYCQVGLVAEDDRFILQMCINYPYNEEPRDFCMELYYTNSTQETWQSIPDCNICRGSDCRANQPQDCYCNFLRPRLKCHVFAVVATVLYSEVTFRVNWRFGSEIYFADYTSTRIFPPRNQSFKINGELIPLTNCSKHFYKLGTNTFKLCTHGFLVPSVSMSFGGLKPPETENSSCITRKLTIKENTHLKMVLNYSDSYENCNYYREHACDIYVYDCESQVEKPVHLTVGHIDLLSHSVCDVRLSVRKEHTVKFCKHQLKDAVLLAMRNDVWVNTTKDCLSVSLVVDFESVTFTFKYIDLCDRSRAYTCIFRGYTQTFDPDTLRKNTSPSCDDCDKEVTTPCYYCDNDIKDMYSQWTPFIWMISLLIVIGSTICFLQISKKIFRKKGPVIKSALPTRSNTKINSERTSEISDFESSEISSESYLPSDDGKSTVVLG